MNKRLLGNTGMEVSELAFGAVEIGMPYGIGVTSREFMLSENAAIALLQASLESGINFFDTARQYGQSENLIGKAFREKRKQVIIATKCKHLRNPDGSLPGNMAEAITGSLQESLAALQTDYADIFMLHDSDPETVRHQDVMSCFDQLKKDGRIRACGVSTYTPAETAAAIDCGLWDMIQVPFNLLDQRQQSLFEKAHQKGIGIVIRSVLMKGLLTSKKPTLHPALTAVDTAIQQFNNLAMQLQYGLSALATKFPLSYPQVSSVLVGLDKMEYLVQSLQVVDGQYLGSAQLERVENMAFPEPDFLNLHEWSVKGWLT